MGPSAKPGRGDGGSDPITRIVEPGYEIAVVVGDRPIDPRCDALDVVVELESGARHAAVFGTVSWIHERLDHFRTSGECAGGLYFWTSDLIVVEELSLDVIRRTVADLLETGEFAAAFSAPSYDINPINGGPTCPHDLT